MTSIRSAPGGSAGRPSAPVASLPDAVLRPVRDGNALESTVEHLAKAIRLGVFAEGERLPPERELAERLKIGRATLREAISALRQAGLVRTSRGRRGGTVVLYRGGLQRDGANYLGRVRRAPTEVADALAFRGVVEPGAAQLAASADLSAAQRAWLSEALRASVKVTADGARRLADSRLHLAIATLSGSALLVDAVTQARSLTAELLTDIPVPASNVAHSDAQHAEIVEAVLNGDHLRAHAVMEDHCKATSARLRAFLG